ncbi:MAG: NAD(P)-dependent oxidoreductase [Sutterella sp.]|nr:NAD(P)-dependent oxidoreductase [Sutterella sp.]
MNDRVLITGINGFIGQSLANKLLNLGMQVIGFSRNPIDNNSNKNLILENVDILDAEKVEKVVLKYKPSYVIHCAAIAQVTHNNISDFYQVNVVGTDILLNALSKHSTDQVRTVLFSTAGVYGGGPDYYKKETSPCLPGNHYSISKLAMEKLCQMYTSELNVTIVRPFNIIGKNQQSNFVISKIYNAFKSRQSILNMGDIDTIRDFVPVNVCAEITTDILLNHADCSLVNICSGVGTSIREALSIFTKIYNYCPEIVINNSFIRRNEIKSLIGDPSYMYTVTNNKFKIPEVYDIFADFAK